MNAQVSRVSARDVLRLQIEAGAVQMSFIAPGIAT